MKKISFINGSPKGKNSFSFKLLSRLGGMMEDEKNIINLNFKGKYEEETFEKLINSDAIVITFSLYYYCLPGILLDFIQQFYEYSKNREKDKKRIRVYAIVNCGFPEPKINEEAIRVIQNFCSKADFEFRFGVSIGGGGVINATQDLVFFKKDISNINSALEEIKSDIYEKGSKKDRDTIMIKPFLAKPIFLFLAGSSWYPLGIKNGLKKKDLFRKPYAQS